VKWRTAVIVSIALTAVLIALYLAPALVQRSQQACRPPLEELVPYIRVEEPGKRYVVEKPLLWAEVNELFWRWGKASYYRYILPIDDWDLRNIVYLYRSYKLNATDPCRAVAEKYKKCISNINLKILFENNCYRLEKPIYRLERLLPTRYQSS